MDTELIDGLENPIPSLHYKIIRQQIILTNLLLYFSYIEIYYKCYKRGRKACGTSSWLSCDMQGKVRQNLHTNQLTYLGSIDPDFSSMMQLGAFLSPPLQDRMLVHCRVTPKIKLTSTHL